MLLSFLLSFGSVCAPALVSLCFKSVRKHSFTVVPLLVAMQWVASSVLAAVLRDMPYTGGKALLIFALAAVFSSYVVYTACKSGFKSHKILSGRRLLFVALLAFIVVADLWIIIGRQGWSFADGNLWPHAESYFRGPLNTDAQRNTNVIESLIRGGGTPFLPHSEYRFQLCWFYWAAVWVSPFHSITRYPHVQGVVLATATLFSFFLIWSVFWLKPSFLLRRHWLWVFLLLFTHSDAFHFLGSTIINHRPGMEADGSFPWIYFRNFSTKLMCLVSGHHTMFFSLLAVFLVIPRVVSSRRTVFFLEGILFGALVLVSSVFSAFFFVFYWPVRAWVEWKRGRDVLFFSFRYLLFVFLSFFIHWGVVGFPPSELFLRQMKGDLHWGSSPFHIQGLVGWLQLPFFPLAVSGLLGLVLLGLAVHTYVVRRRVELKIWPYLSSYFLGNLFCYYVLLGTEFQRHFAILSAFVGALLLVQWIPRQLFQGKNRWMLRQTGWCALGLHLYFILSFTAKPNAVDVSIPWEDYFKLNQVLREKHPNAAVISPLAHLNGGFPVTMEAVTSFSMPVDVYIHSQVTEEQKATLMRATAARSIAPYALNLGYEMITWGPLEDKRWGDKVKRRFVDETLLVEQVGDAKLYRLKDQFFERFSSTEPQKSARYQANLGDAFNRDGWEQEAFEAYQAAVEKDSSLGHCWNNLGELMLRGGLPVAAVQYFETALSLEPDSSVAHYNLGTAYALMERNGLALREFLAAENADRDFFKAKEMVSRALIELGRRDLAETAVFPKPKKGL